MKRYDQSYFDRWYRSRQKVDSAASLGLKVRLAVAAAEFVLNREIRSVLDVGCGEAPWRAALRRMRPGIIYLGVDSSEYAVRRYGKRRNIRLGSVGTLGGLRLRRPFDLVVCSNVLMYVPASELRRGLMEMRRLLRGVAFIETYTSGDEVVGDLEGWHQRTEAEYRKAFNAAGLISCGLNNWFSRDQRHLLSDLERAG